VDKTTGRRGFQHTATPGTINRSSMPLSTERGQLRGDAFLMRNDQRWQQQWDQEDANPYGAYDEYSEDDGAYGAYGAYSAYDEAPGQMGYPANGDGYDMAEVYGATEGFDEGEYPADEERGLMLQPEQSLVNISSTITQHGAPLLSYSRTMNRFYATRKQRLSMGRFKCEVCGERISMWAWETSNGKRTHEECYERLAWAWTNLYAQQQRQANEGNFE